LTHDGTFATDLANGNYSVTLSSGDASLAHDQETVYLEGKKVDSFSTAINQFVSRTYQVMVSTSQLDLRMADQGGEDKTCAINALVITAAGPRCSAGPNFTTNEGQSVTFAGTASGGTAPLSYLWNFGDGGTVSGSLTPSHVYSTYGTYTATLTVTDAKGLSANSSLTATVNDVAPTVNIGGPYQGNAQIPVQFSGSATEPNPKEQASLSYVWNFGDGTTATGTSPSHAFAADGIYTVTLTVTNTNGLSTRATTTLDVYPSVSAGSNLTANEGTVVNFSGTAVGSIWLTYQWAFGDGGTASGTLTPSHVYTTYGTYTATLTATDSQGLSASSFLTATVNDVAPTVNIGGPYRGNAQVPVNFSGSATEPNPKEQASLSYLWNFGDGTTATGSSSSHAFALDGAYNVTLTATNTQGLSSTATTVVDVYPSVTAGIDPEVNEGQPVNFQGTATGSNSLTYHWDFGDGATADGTLTPSHVYYNHGDYAVVLTATDPVYGFSSSSTLQMIVNDVPPTVTIGVPASGVAGQPVSFTASATSPSPVDQAAGFTYNWSFGDGSTGTGANPSHPFAAAGNYTVSVTATDKDGATSTPATGIISVAAVLMVSAGSNLNAIAGSPITFAGTVSGGASPYTYSWNFGDGSVSTGFLNPSHTYSANGTYTVVLSVSDGSGQYASNSLVATIGNPSGLATTYSLSTPNPATGAIGVPSGAFTVALPAGLTVSSPVTVTPSDGGAGGTFAPATVILSSSNPAATFTYTAVNPGAATIATTNTGGLTNPGPVLFLANNPALVSKSFDFGTATSPVAAGYTQVDASTWYSSQTGYGWTQGTNIQERDYGVGSDLDRDFCFVNPGDYGVLRVDLPYGYYSVLLTTGNAYYDLSQEAFYLQSNLVDTISVPAGQWATRTYNLIVTGGYLSLGVSMPHGGAINGLSITEGSAPPTISAGLNLRCNEGQSVAFAGLAIGCNPLTYNWSFGDGGTASGSLTPTHTFIPDGVYTTTLTVTDAYGLSSQSTLTATVKIVPPAVALQTPPSTGFTGTPISFSASATDVDPVDQAAGFTYLWNFGDGTTATGSSPTHTYFLDALYTVTVTATDEDGQSGSASAQVNVFRAGHPGDTTATYFTLTPPSSSSGVVGIPSGMFTVGLPNGRVVSAPVTVTPSDGGAGGVFTPAQIVLSNSNPTATFTYTAMSAGTISISAADSGGLNVPSPVNYAANNPVMTYTLSGPSSGDLGTTSTFTVTLGPGLLLGSVQITPSASNGDGTFSPSAVTLTRANPTATFTYSAARWGTRNIATTNNDGMPDPTPSAFVSKIQLGSSGTAPSGNQAPDLGGFDFFANGAWWQELGRTVVSDPVAPNSASLTAGFGSGDIRIDWSTTTANGGNSIYGIPFTVVSGNAPLDPISLTTYAAESDPGPVPFYPSMSIENWYSATGTPPTPNQDQDGSDHHALVMVRDEATGGISKIYEYYQVSSPDGGTTWQSVGGAQWDLTTGAPRPEFWSSSDAAGLPISPLMVNYSEAALAAAGGPAIDHPFRVAISPGLSLNNFVWPARHAVTSGSATTGLPMGSRLRLSQDWYDANINSFSPIDRAIVTAMYNYGVIVADLSNGGFWLSGVNDQRWSTSDLSALGGIPVSAFQVLDTIKSPVSFTGPASGQPGSPQTFTVQYQNSADSNFMFSMYLFQSSDGGNTWSSTGWNQSSFVFDDNHRAFTATFTPPSAGTYLLKAVYGGFDFITPGVISFTATATPAARTVTSTQSGDWSNPATWGGLTPPGAGDIAVINNNVTITQNTTIGDGSSTTVLSVGTASAGSLTITGAVLTIRGNSSIGYHDGTLIAHPKLTIQSSGSTPAGIIFDGNSGVAPVMSIGDNVLVTITGTSSARCFIRTKSAAKGDGSDSVGANGRIGMYNTSGSYYFCFYMNAQYFDLYKLGDASNPGITSGFISSCITTPANPPFVWDHFTVDSCGETPVIGVTGATANCQFTNGTWTNQLSHYGQQITGDLTTLTTGTRLVDHCSFMGRAYFFAPGNFTVTNNYFADELSGSSGPGNWAVFDGNFVTRTNDDGEECIWSGSATNCYAYTTQTTSTCVALLNSSADATVAGNVGEYAGSGAVALFAGTEESISPTQTYVVQNNIAFSSSTGSWSPFFGCSSNPAENPSKSFAQVTHNTVVTSGYSPINGAAMQVATYQQICANVLVNTGSTAGTAPYNGVYVFDNVSRIYPAYGYVVDEVPASAILANCWRNFGTVATGSFQTVAPTVPGAVAAVTNGTVYYSAMSTGTPGVGDLANVDPQFYDPTRNLATWDSVVMGGPGTAAHAETLLQATPTLVKSSLLPWVRTGYAPTNAALKNASYPGDSSTADANGNAWPGGGPGIGAMGWIGAVVPPAPSQSSVPAAPAALPALQGSPDVSQSMTSSVGAGGATVAQGLASVVVATDTSTPTGTAAHTIQTQKKVIQETGSAATTTVALASPSSQNGFGSRNVPFRASRFRLLQSISSLSTED
jgi:PKD repeat protein